MKEQAPRSGLTLIRLVFVRLHPPPTQGNSFNGSVGRVGVQTLGSVEENEALLLLLAGEYGLVNRPKIDCEGTIAIPAAPRKRIERVLETVANLVSVFSGISRVISSPVPCVALRPETDDARDWLTGAKRIEHQDRIVDVPYGSSPIPFDGAIMTALGDRLDGVALLAEAFAQDHAVGRFRELMRVFERAFALPPGALPEPLVAFLDKRFRYTLAELDRWFKLRGPVTHADRRPEFVLEPDVRPVLHRMEQAAIDILMNKKFWRSKSVERRFVWNHHGWTTSANGSVILRRGSTARIGAQFLDQFGTFPTDLRGIVAGRLPDAWWAPMPSPKTPTRSFKVIG